MQFCAMALASLTLWAMPDLGFAKCQVRQGRGTADHYGWTGSSRSGEDQWQGCEVRLGQRRVLQHDECGDSRRIRFEIKGRSLIGLSVHGIGGIISTSVANVKEFTVAGITIHDVEFLVGGSEVGDRAGGCLAKISFEKWDVEYDFAKGIVTADSNGRIVSNAVLAYWVTPRPELIRRWI